MSVYLKSLHVTFEIVPDFKPYIHFAKFSSPINFDINEGTSLSALNLNLDDNIVYDISFDQSTTNTGIFIKAHNNTEIFMIEVYKKAGTSTEDYMFELETIIHSLCEDKLLLHLIYEKPIKSNNFRSSQVLFQLEGLLRMFAKRYKEFKSVKYETISKFEWAANIFDKQKFGSDYSDKHLSKQAIINLFDWTHYFGSSLYQDNDGYEAVGVMMGWFISAYDPLGRPYVRGDNFNGTVGCIVLPGVPYSSLYEELKKEEVDTKWFVFNPKTSIFKNIIKAAEQNYVVLVHIEDPYIKLALSVESNLKLFECDYFTLVIATPNFMSASAKRILGSQFHFYL